MLVHFTGTLERLARLFRRARVGKTKHELALAARDAQSRSIDDGSALELRMQKYPDGIGARVEHAGRKQVETRSIRDGRPGATAAEHAEQAVSHRGYRHSVTGGERDRRDGERALEAAKPVHQRPDERDGDGYRQEEPGNPAVRSGSLPQDGSREPNGPRRIREAILNGALQPVEVDFHCLHARGHPGAPRAR